jgi:MFS family permease
MALADPTPKSGWLSRNVVVLSGVSFLQDAASELLYPLLPIFLTAVLGAPAAVVGAVEGLAEGAASLTRLGAGALADRYPRRALIGLGYGLAAAGKVLVAVAFVWPVVLAGRVVDRLGKGVRGAPRDALLVQGVPAAARGRVFGLHRSADTSGAIVGPLLGLAGYELLDHRIRPLLVIAVVPAVLSALLVAAVRERARPAQQARPAREAPSAAVPEPPTTTLPARYWRVVAVLVLFSLVNFPDALLLLRLRDIGFGVPAVILAYVGYNGVYALASFPAGWLADRLRPRLVFGVGLVFFAVGYLGLGLTRDHTVAWLLLAAYGLFTAGTDGVGKAWVSGLVGAGQQGRAQGGYQGLSGFGILFAGLWAGLLWGADGRLPLLLSGAVGALVAAGLLAASLVTGGWRAGRRPVPAVPAVESRRADASNA